MRIGNARGVAARASLLGLALLAAATAAVATEPVSGQRSAESVSVPVGSLQVAIDARTGRLRQPTPEEARALARELARLCRPGMQGTIAPTEHPDGTIGLTVGSEHTSFYVLRFGPDGTLESACVQGAHAASAPGVTGDVVRALDPADAAGPTTFDACSPLTDAAAVAGKIALVDRGTCIAPVKTKHAQNAGVAAVLFADNAPGSPAGFLGGVDPTITIVTARITQVDGNAIKAALGGGTVNVTLGLDMTLRAGTERGTGLVLLNATNPLQQGTSIVHWDGVASPNQLMEAAIFDDVSHLVSAAEDLTLAEMTDIGWFSDGDGVPDGRDTCLGSTPTVVIDTCDSGVANDVFADGCTISDAVNGCAVGAKNRGAFVSCVAQITDGFKKRGLLTGSEKGSIQSCAARADIP